MYYMEKKLKPEVEKEIKKGFFEIRKKAFDQNGIEQPEKEEEVQVYVSHICLHNFHPIFSKMNIETVKTFLSYSTIIYLNKGQTLYSPGFNDSYFYVVLFGKCRILRPGLHSPRQMEPVGQELNLGWTIGEEILFKAIDGKKMSRRETCKSLCDSCVLGIDRKGLAEVKKYL